MHPPPDRGSVSLVGCRIRMGPGSVLGLMPGKLRGNGALFGRYGNSILGLMPGAEASLLSHTGGGLVRWLSVPRVLGQVGGMCSAALRAPARAGAPLG